MNTITPPTLSELRKKYRDEYVETKIKKKKKKSKDKDKDKKKDMVNTIRESVATSLKINNEFQP